MANMNMIQALNSAMDIMLGRDPSVVLMGEDIGYFGGVFRATEGLQRKYGEHRVLDTPIAEGGIIGTAIGMAVNGLRPVAEIQFADYIYPGFDQIVSELARLRYRSAGDFFAPVTIRTPCGGGIRGGQTHSQSPEGIFTHVSGVKVVMPSNPYDAKGLLITAIEDDDPVIFFEPKRLYNGPFDGDPGKPAVPWSAHPKGQVPEGHYKVPLGLAEVVRKGTQMTIVTYGTMVFVAQAAAAALGVDAEIVDLRSLVPLDVETIVHLGQKNGTLRGGPRSDALLRVWRRARRGDPGGVLLASGGTDSARRRLGYALSSCFRMGVLSRPTTSRDGPQGRDGVGMSQFVFKMPDLGEGTVEAEIVAWHTKPGATVAEDQIIVEVMTDKAAVEVPAPVSGKVVSITGGPGDKVAVGSPLIVFDVGAAAAAGAEPGEAPKTDGRRRLDSAQAEAPKGEAAKTAARAMPARRATVPPPPTGRIMTSPANRRRAREAGIDLTTVVGSGPGGRIVREDLASPASRSERRRFRGNVRDQGHRGATPDRRAHERGQAQHPAFRLRRRGRCDRTGGAASAPQFQECPGRTLLDLPAAGHRGPGTHVAIPSRSATSCTTPRAGCWCAIAPCTWGSPLRPRMA